MFNPASVHVTEVPIPVESPADDGPVYPSVIDVGTDGSVYFGQLNTSEAIFGNFGIFRYSGGGIVQTLPFPQQNMTAGGVDAIDAHDSPTVVWSSTYKDNSQILAFGDNLECGANGNVASACSFSGLAGFIYSLVVARDGTVWTAGANCCGAGAGAYPAQFPSDAAANSSIAILANGPNSHVWGLLEPSGPMYEFDSNGAVLNTYELLPGSTLQGIDVLVQGPDGNLWFTDAGHNAIARMTPSGVITEFPIPTANSGVESIAVSTDGALWFTETTASKVGRIDITGKIYDFTLPTPNAGPTAIAPAPPLAPATAGRLWFTETSANKIASITY